MLELLHFSLLRCNNKSDKNLLSQKKKKKRYRSINDYLFNIKLYVLFVFIIEYILAIRIIILNYVVNQLDDIRLVGSVIDFN